MQISGTIDSVLNNKTPAIWSVQPEATVFNAIKMMSDKNIGALLVMNCERLIGIFSERDYTRKVVLKGKSSKATAVREIISEQVISVDSSETIEHCMHLMTEHRIRHLPVMNGNTVIGIVSIGDLVNYIISAQHLALAQMEDYISGKYPG
jgi:CBS domain-containing protein